MKSKNAVVIVAAGRGLRIATVTDSAPKQYHFVAGKAILQHTIEVFSASKFIDFIQVVIHPDDVELYNETIKPHPKLSTPIFGGETRQESCANGIFALADDAPNKILIHDGARPFVTQKIIDDVLDAVSPNICALPAHAIADTLKLANSVDGRLMVEKTISREGLYAAQTPQGFIFDEIVSAHQAARTNTINHLTDDAAVAQWAGMKIVLVPSPSYNSKITTIEDIDNAKKTMQVPDKYNIPDIRNGTGYDVHRLIDGEGVTLCGIKIASDKKLDGHSDADVAMHAITDALLGSIGSGDIGSHFPPSDNKWRGASSDQFLAHACNLIQNKNGFITHMDVTIICEYPKVGPHREAMRKSLSAITNVDVERISVKATTNEEIGSIGRGEGIAAIASATVVIRNED